MTPAFIRRRAAFLTGLFLATCAALLAPLLATGALAQKSPPKVSRPAPPPPAAETKKAKTLEGPWQAQAQKLNVDHATQIMEASGEVFIWRGTDSLKADFVRYFLETEWAYLEGNVEVHWGPDVLYAERAEFDLRRQVGWVSNGRLVSAQPGLRVSGEEVRKVGDDVYEFKNATLTACDAETPAWAVHAKDGVVDADGRTNMRLIDFRVLGLPVAGAPYLSAPSQNKPTTGLLTPEIATSSRLGFQYNQPVYIAIDQEKDLTLYENFMSKRGFMQGLEFRHAGDSQTKGMWRLDYLKDSTRATTEGEESEGLDDDGLIRPNRDRWWIRSKLDTWVVNPDIQVKMDLDYVSDQNYLREFNSGPSGFRHDRNEFLQQFKRDIIENDSLLRTSTLLVGSSQDAWGLWGRADYTENLAYRNQNLSPSEDPTVQRLPGIAAYWFKDKVFQSPVEFEAETTTDYFWRRFGTSGGRFDLRPRASMPFDLGPVSVAPRAGFRQTNYLTDTFQGEQDQEISRDPSQSRTAPELGLDAFMEFERIFDLGAPTAVPTGEDGKPEWRFLPRFGSWTRLRHSIQPRLEYEYVSLASQSRLPSYDRLDRLRPQNRIVYSLTQGFTRRLDSPASWAAQEQARQSGETPPPGSPKSEYLEVLNFRLEQAYDYREEERDDELDRFERRPFSDFLAEATLRLDDRLSLTSRTFFSPYVSSVTQHEHLLDWTDPTWGRAYVGLDFVEQIEEFNRVVPRDYSIIRVGGLYNYSQTWAFMADYRFDYELEREIEKHFAVTYNHQCYSVGLGWLQSPGDDRFEVRFDLKGLSLF